MSPHNKGSHRPKTFLEQQPYMAAFGLAFAMVSPFASMHQLLKLNPQVPKPSQRQAVQMCSRILPHQTFLKIAQLDASTPIKENMSPWMAFAVIGVLQGGVYGQSNIFLSQQLGIGSAVKKASYLGMFRGSIYAGTRDLVSQGLPFMFSDTVKEKVFDPVFGSRGGEIGESAKRWTSVIATSVVSTVLSQGLHNCQITMQANQSLGYVSAFKQAYASHGIGMLYKGASSRIGLLVVMNVLNESLLKAAWEPVPIDQEKFSLTKQFQFATL